MYINLDKFYSSNYRDFVHRQALEDALKLVAEIYLKDTKVDTILNITFSVDEYGENPIYLTYLDEEKKEHIVKLKPNITEALLERLKEYAKITYVDEQDEKLRQELTQIIEQSKQEAIDTANNFTISHTDEVKNDILNIINQTSDDLKEYCDNKCKMTLSAGKNYTDAKADEINQRIDEEHEYNRERYVIGTINKDGLDTDKRFTEIGLTPNKKQYAHLVNFADTRNNDHEINHASGYLLNYDGYTNLVTNLSKAGIPIYLTMQDGKPLFVSEISFLAREFTNQDFISAELKDGVNDVRGFLINHENLEKLYALDLSVYATKEELNALDSKVDLVNQQVETNEEAITDNSNRIVALDTNIANNTSKLSNVWDGHRAPFIYWTPNIDINTLKLENTENDVKVTLNDDDVVYWRKNEYQPVDLTNYYTKPESDEKYATKDVETKLSEFPNTGKATFINWYPDVNVHYIRMVKDGEYVRGHVNDISINGEQIVYLPLFKPAKESEVSALKTLVAAMGETHPIEMNVSYNGSNLDLSNYSSYTTIGNTTLVNINCSFIAPFASGTVPITNTLNISSETLKSFPTFMIDCIVNTITNISSYTTTAAFPNNFVRFSVVTPVIPSNENIKMTTISFNGSFIFQQ